jgi:hypothetical protein
VTAKERCSDQQSLVSALVDSRPLNLLTTHDLGDRSDAVFKIRA